MELICKNAGKAYVSLLKYDEERKNEVLRLVADALIKNARRIIDANKIDLDEVVKKGMKVGLIDRLTLNEDRIRTMADGLVQISLLPTPLKEVVWEKERYFGKLTCVRVPIGVVAIIYESRPNVTSDAFGLCFKTGNSVVLKGGSDAINSNCAIVDVIRECLAENGIDENVISLIKDVRRESVLELIRMRKYVDLVIPRGGAGLINFVVENATVPVIETGAGNCHVYVDEFADLDMAVRIIINAKTQRVGVCNACESLVVHKKIAEKFIPMIADALSEHSVQMRGDELSCSIDARIIPATDEDYFTEYLDYIISIKTVDTIEEAIEHINMCHTKHSDAIVTENEHNQRLFLDFIDSACVYVNASTRFTDGNEFGYGAEIGISTQKLHARGPMGLTALTTTKIEIIGKGSIRQ